MPEERPSDQPIDKKRVWLEAHLHTMISAAEDLGYLVRVDIKCDPLTGACTMIPEVRPTRARRARLEAGETS